MLDFAQEGSRSREGKDIEPHYLLLVQLLLDLALSDDAHQ